MTTEQTISTFQRNDVVKDRGGFVNTIAVKYVWARIFPTLFSSIFYEGKWVIMYDITCYSGVRYKYVSFDQWIKYQMWCEEGLPASNPTFCLVLENYSVRRQL